jgi:site-specific DNA-methyltransferase (adenine-specific)
MSMASGARNHNTQSTAVRVKGRLNQGSGKLKNRILNRSEIDWDNSPPPPEYFTELFRVTKNQIIFGGNYFNLPPTRCIICWDKLQPWDNFSQWEMAWTSFDKPAKMYRLSNTGGANAIQKIHPTQKPELLYGWIIDDFVEKRQSILDTNMGSQTLRIAAFKKGFDFYGAELSPTHFQDGCDYFNMNCHGHHKAKTGELTIEQRLF